MSDYKNLDNHIWLNRDIDKKASDYFAVLLAAKVELEEVELTEVELTELQITEVEPIVVDTSMELDIDKKAKLWQAIEDFDRTLKKNNNNINKGTKVHLQASLQYLQLRNMGQNKINASTTIASSLG
ncbi:21520_t:CDS:2 [Gigaspora margarita]|uniref:21520_t:CDS:1 n=1 Tax=Gigaspora margarita TaxID=4874 RepID=A0ABN7UFF0_GIGMA|nr:21520_t:CDS:2 [Gigaspora margarita]